MRDQVSPIDWEPQAAARLAKVPFFIRPLVRRRAEHAARERRMESVTAALLGELKTGQHGASGALQGAADDGEPR